MIEQVAVKALIVYSTDESSEAKDKKMKVSDSMNVCIHHLRQRFPPCRGYGMNSGHVHDSNTDTFYLFVAIHVVSAH
jgi:hypothetical protein